MALQYSMDKLPPKTALYLLIGSGVLVLFVLLGIVPMQKHLLGLDRQIEQTKFRIEEQNALHPIYLKMQAIGRAGGATAPKLPDKASLGQTGVADLTDSLAQVIIKSGLEAQSVVPDPSSLGKGSKTLAVSVHVRGPMERFREFLSELVMLPSFENVENIQIQPGSGPREYKLKLWMTAE